MHAAHDHVSGPLKLGNMRQVDWEIRGFTGCHCVRIAEWLQSARFWFPGTCVTAGCGLCPGLFRDDHDVVQSPVASAPSWQ